MDNNERGDVYVRMAKVAAELSRIGIDKSDTNTFDKYKFRGIDSLYNALSPALVKAGITITPTIIDREIVSRTSQKGGELIHTTVTVRYDICSVDGSIHPVVVMGEAMDRGDKSLNKAMTAAYKCMAFQTFCIPIVGAMDDADSETHEVGPIEINWVALDEEIEAAQGEKSVLTEVWKKYLKLAGTDEGLRARVKAAFPKKEPAKEAA